MNAWKLIGLALVGYATATTIGFANFIGADNFDDNVKNPTLWGTDLIDGNGALAEINSRLEYTGSGPGVNDANRPWTLNYGSFTSDWQLTLDVFNSHVAAPGEVSSFGMEVFQRDGSPNNSVFVELYSVEGKKGFYSVLRENDIYVAEVDTGNLDAQFGTVRISYDAGSQTMTTSYDPDGSANGFLGIPLGSFGINGSGGATGNANWGMDAASEFYVNVYGYSEEATITSGMLYGDNFTAVPEPSAWALLIMGMVAIFAAKKTHRSR